MFISRMITAIVAIAFLVLIMLCEPVVLLFAAFAISQFILYELFKASKLLNKGILSYMGFIPPFFVFVNSQSVLQAFLFLYIILLFTILVFKHEKTDLSDIATIFFVSLSVPFMFNYIVRLREIPEIGNYALWAVFIGACMSDTFAYAVGSLFGKRKLAPAISPKKTVEGSVGAVLGTVICMLLYGLLLECVFKCTVNYLYIAVLGALCSIFGQMGDLSASIIKRKCGIKDFGTIFPGHGGFMERFDSILFVAPLVYHFLLYVPFITV